MGRLADLFEHLEWWVRIKTARSTELALYNWALQLFDHPALFLRFLREKFQVVLDGKVIDSPTRTQAVMRKLGTKRLALVFATIMKADPDLSEPLLSYAKRIYGQLDREQRDEKLMELLNEIPGIDRASGNSFAASYRKHEEERERRQLPPLVQKNREEYAPS